MQCEVDYFLTTEYSLPFQKENNLSCANFLSIAGFFLSARQFGNDVKLAWLQRHNERKFPTSLKTYW